MNKRLITLTVALAFVITLPAFASDGAAIYKTKCAACHGPDGAGKTMKLRDLRSGEVQKQTDLELTKIISGGKGKMPAFGKQLSTADVEALISFIRTIKAK
jgi:quinoprotein glucose dehydrogenase